MHGAISKYLKMQRSISKYPSMHGAISKYLKMHSSISKYPSMHNCYMKHFLAEFFPNYLLGAELSLELL